MAGCIVLLVLALFSGSCATPLEEIPKDYTGHALLQIYPASAAQVAVLEALEEDEALLEELDFWKKASTKAPADILVSPNALDLMLETLRSNEIRFKVLHNNIQRLIDEEKPREIQRERKQACIPTYPKWHPRSCSYTGNKPSGIVTTYARHADINVWLDKKASEFKSIASTQKIGRSYEGRTMKIIKIGKPGSNKPAIWLDAGIHAREWIAPATLIWIINKMLMDYGQNLTITNIIDRYDWYMLPVANPDGYEYSHTTQRLWRKTRSPNRNSRCVGVDPNRNFDNHFGEAGVSTNPCAPTYPGTKAFSEVETRNMRDFISAHRKQLKMYLSFHSYYQLWLTPWGYTQKSPEDGTKVDFLARIGASALHSKHGKVFKVGSPAKILYSAAGGSYDWAKGNAGIKYSYTLELRPSQEYTSGFILPTHHIQPSGEEVYAGIVAIVKQLIGGENLIGL